MINTIKAVFVWILVFCSILFSSCKHQISTKENHITYDTIQSSQEIFLFNNPTLKGAHLDICFIIPQSFANKNETSNIEKLQKTFSSLMFDSTYNNTLPLTACNNIIQRFKDKKESLEEEYASLKEIAKEGDYPFREEGLDYYESIKDSILYDYNGIISLQVIKSNYSGGAHGSESLLVKTIQTNGEIITEKDIFKENYYDSLKDILVKNILFQNNVQNVDELTDIGYISPENIIPNGNFYLNEKGITYIFQEYEIACYAIGIVEIFLPFEDIKHLMKKESPISFLIKAESF